MGFETSDSAVALVGMVGFALLAAIDIDGELHQLVETTATVVGCGGRGTRALSKGRRHVRVRDLPTGGRPVVVVVWRKRIWRCPEADCEVGSWTEQTTAVAPRASMTERGPRRGLPPGGRAEPLGGRCGPGLGRRLEHGHGCGVRPRPTARRRPCEGVAGVRPGPRRGRLPAGQRPSPHHLRHQLRGPGSGSPHRRRPRSQRQGGARLAGNPSLVVAGRDRHGGPSTPSGATPTASPTTWATPSWWSTRSTPSPWPTEPSTTYAAGSSRTLGHRGRSGPPLRHPPAAAAGHRAPHRRQRARLEAGLAGDPVDEVLDTVLAKEALRWSYAVPDLAEATRRFDTFIAECRISRVPELHRLARTALHWRTEILAHHRHRGLQRAHRGGESRRQVGSASAPWLPQLRELSAPGPSSLRGGMAHSSCRTNQAALSPLSRVEPNNEQVNLSQPQFA